MSKFKLETLIRPIKLYKSLHTFFFGFCDFFKVSIEFFIIEHAHTTRSTLCSKLRMAVICFFPQKYSARLEGSEQQQKKMTRMKMPPGEEKDFEEVPDGEGGIQRLRKKFLMTGYSA